jgi:L-alanine-DL-glutamate epimerase-like enolase superfamily enzyme
VTGAAKIAEVRAFALAYPEPHDGGRTRHLSLVRIETSDGHVGWGEAITGLPEASRAVNLIVEDGFAPLLAGEDPTRIGALIDRLRTHTFWYGAGGLATMAISGVDIALWDLAGKVAGVPVHALLGGKLMDRVTLCASVIWDTEDLDATAEWFASFRERGYTHVKAGWGRRPDAAFGIDAERDVELVRCAREALGPEVRFAADVSYYAPWTTDHAIKMAKRLGEFDLAWLEDPLADDNLAGYARLRSVAPMAIATGERAWRVADYERIFAADAADVVLLDPGRIEGITGMRAAVDLAARAQVEFAPHSWSSAVNTAAALHVFASVRNGRVFELKPDPSPMQHELVAKPFEAEHGYLTVPDGPGLGIDVSEEAVSHYALG